MQREYVEDLFTNCNDTITPTANLANPVLSPQALLLPTAENNPGNSWAHFKIYLDVAAEACAKKTNEKWVGKMGGADVFGFENAVKMVDSLRIDWGSLGLFGVG